MNADLALQKAIVQRLTGNVDLTNLVPANNILDRHSLPAPDPSIILGESQSLDGEVIDRQRRRIYFTMHVWKKEPGLRGAKEIVAAILLALKDRLQLEDGWHCGDLSVSEVRMLRDPDEQDTSHGVVTLLALVGRL